MKNRDADLSPEKSDHEGDNTKRKLDYMDASENATPDGQEEIIQLTPHILDESKTFENNYSKPVDSKLRKQLQEEHKFINITNETLEYQVDDPSHSTPSPHK